MMNTSEHGRLLPACLLGAATAIVAYLPAVGVWGAASRWLKPVAHAEEVMGRGLEAVFIGGPLISVILAVIAGTLAYRSIIRVSVAAAVLLLVAAMAIAAMMAKTLNI